MPPQELGSPGTNVGSGEGVAVGVGVAELLEKLNVSVLLLSFVSGNILFGSKTTLIVVVFPCAVNYADWVSEAPSV